MYNQFLSSQWFFDRCLEASSLFLPLVVLSSVLILLMLRYFLKIRKIFWIFLILFIPVIVFFCSYLLGISKCNAYHFWDSIEPALKLDEKVEKMCMDQNCPKSEDELSKLDIDLYQQISSNARVKYYFDSAIKEYVWYIRPSRYYVFKIEDGSFSLYKIPSILPAENFGVPFFNGDKELLPK